jgi:DNA-binding NarL/FixJ family response regulator
MGGRAAAEDILELDPQAKIIVSSGYATDPVMANYQAYGFKGVAVKPFRFAELQKVIRQVLKMA